MSVLRLKVLGKLSVLLGMFLLASGCSVSKYHLGVHHLDENRNLFAPVSANVDAMTEKSEEIFIHSLVNYNASALRGVLSERLQSQLNKTNVNQLFLKLKDEFDFSGQYDRMFQSLYPSRMMDEGVVKDPFEYYDFVSRAFHLIGKTDALVKVYSTAIGSEIKICGFDIMKYGSKDQEEHPPIHFLAPESKDRAKIIGRPYKTIEDK
jgi:hypothetical protein